MAEVGWTEKVAKEWHKYQPPSRPSFSEVKIYENHIKSLPKGSSMLILGSTPEIRDLAAKYQMKVTICDWSEDVFEALKLLMMHKNQAEFFSKQDWRQMSFDEKFDMVIGDCATTVVPYSDLEKVFDNIAEKLKHGGLAVQRIWVRHPDQKYSLGDIVALFEKNPENIHWYTWNLFPVLLHYYDTEKESLSGEELYQRMSKDFEEGQIPEKLLKLFSLVQNHKTQNNVLLKERLENIIKKRFKILAVEYGNDNFRMNAPIYVLRRK